MTWSAFIANVQWFGPTSTWGGGAVSALSAGDQATIEAALQTLYNGSATAQAVMDRSVQNGPLYLGAAAQGQIAFASRPLDFAAFNLADIGNFYYFNSKGELVNEILGITVIHELVHAIDDLVDLTASTEAAFNSPNFDQAGATLAVQNIISAEMGWNNNIQPSYLAAMLSTSPTFSNFTTGQSYSGSNTIDTARIGTASGDNIDHSQNTAKTRDLLFGLQGDDTIRAGVGDDYLYGGAGVDTLAGGAGADQLHGGQGDDMLIGGAGDDILFGGDTNAGGSGDGTDTADYSRSDVGATASNGITVNFDFAAAEQYQGQTVVRVSNDGQGGADRLASIEKIITTSANDIFLFKGAAPAAVTITVETRGGSDVIDASQSSQGYMFAGGASSLTASARSAGSGAVAFQQFNGLIKGSTGNDFFDAPGVKVEAGDGADYIMFSGSDVDAGAGEDRIDIKVPTGQAKVQGGTGNDTYDIQTGGQVILKFNAGDGHDVVKGDTSNVLIDFGAASLSSLKIAWNKTFTYAEDYLFEYGGRNDYPVHVDNYAGDMAIVLPSGDTIALGRVEGSSSAFIEMIRGENGDPNPTPWTIEVIGDFKVKGAEGEMTLQEFTELIGLVEPNDSYGSIEPDYSPSSNHQAGGSQWFTNFFTVNGTYSPPVMPSQPGPMLATAANEVFLGNSMSRAVSFENATSGVQADLSTSAIQNTLWSGSDQFLNINELIGGDFNDTLTAGGTDAILSGAAGADVLHGGLGFDMLSGGEGNDQIFAGTNGGSLMGDDGDDLLVGQDLFESLDGGAGDDTLSGGDGDDFLIGGLGDDVIDGGAGRDWLAYDNASATVVVNLQTGQASGGDGADTLSNIEDVAGSAYDDIITGTAGANFLAGGAGDDQLFGGDGDDELRGDDGDDIADGGAGADRFYASMGEDTYTGGAGADQFIFYGSDTKVTITDFKANGDADIIGLSSAFATNFGALIARSSQVGGNVEIQYVLNDPNSLIILQGVQLSSLSQADFEFL